MKTVLKNLFILVVTISTSFFSVNKVTAQTTSLTSGGTAASVAVSGTTAPISWTNATNTRLSSNDNSFATVALDNG